MNSSLVSQYGLTNASETKWEYVNQSSTIMVYIFMIT